MSDDLHLMTLADAALADVRARVELRQKGLQLRGLSPNGSGWWPMIGEPFTGAWQRNIEISSSSALTYFAVYSCVRLISTDIGKLCLRLVQQDDEGIWTEIDSPSFSPVIRKPNRYQTINKFIEQWIISKLLNGNAYVLLQRDQRQVVVAMYVLDPARVTPLVAQDGSVYYELKRDDLSGLASDVVTVPASEIIHDTMITPYHPLIGVSPLYASGLAATQGLSIQNSSNSFFSAGSNPGGVLTAPGAISDITAARLKAYWDENYSGANVGKVAVLGDGLKYEKMVLTAVESQLIDQLKWTAENVCSTFGVPPYLVDVGPPPPYANFEPLLLKYHSQCIQSLTTHFEKSLEVGLGMVEKIDGKRYGFEFDIDDLIWMDTATRIAAAKDGIGSGGMSPNEARKKYFGLGSVEGGDTPYMQNQMWPLKQLAERETPAAPALPAMPVVGTEDEDADEMDMAAAMSALERKFAETDFYGARP
jgi:HK97 family phage portal protein